MHRRSRSEDKTAAALSQKISVTLYVNGVERSLSIRPWTTLLDALTVPYWNDGEEWENGSFPWASFAADPSHSGSDSES
jgi:hypothetical protein